MEFRTEYNLTLTTGLGRVLVRALVEYSSAMFGVGDKPTLFEIPGVLRIDNLVLIEKHEYEVVPNPALSTLPPDLELSAVEKFMASTDPRYAALNEETCLNVKFVVWQRFSETVNTQHE